MNTLLVDEYPGLYGCVRDGWIFLSWPVNSEGGYDRYCKDVNLAPRAQTMFQGRIIDADIAKGSKSWL